MAARGRQIVSRNRFRAAQKAHCPGLHVPFATGWRQYVGIPEVEPVAGRPCNGD